MILNHLLDWLEVVSKMMFDSVEETIQKLSLSLPKIDDTWYLIAVSEHGEKLAKGLSESLKVNFDKLFIESVYCQMNRDCEIAMISEFENIFYDEVLLRSFDINRKKVSQAISVIYNYKLVPRLKAYRGSIKNITIPENVKNIILIDETIETGLRMESAIATVSNRFDIENIYVATPILQKQIFNLLKDSVKDIFSYKQVEVYTDASDYFSYREYQVHETEEPFHHI
jgi:putative phosphoribosyl transferase